MNWLDETWPQSTQLYAHVLWVLAESIKATSILEIGIGPDSVSGCTFIFSMAQRGGGKLLSIDVDPSLPHDRIKCVALDHGVQWTQIYGDSLAVVDLVPSDLQVDLLYVDGDHDFTHAYWDTKSYLPFLRPGGYLVIDDYPMFEGVREAAEILQREGFTFVHLAHEGPHGNGRLLWQKPRA